MNINLLRYFSLFLSIFFSATALAGQIDLNDFYADPSVTIAADGSSALLVEDTAISPILLSNDPGLGDPNIILPDINSWLFFNYQFTEGLSDDDEFFAFVIDAITGASVGAGFEFVSQSRSSGTVSFNLSSLVGQTLGLQFQLNSLVGDAGFDSSVMVSNVEIKTVPEPNSLWLIGAAFISWVCVIFLRSGYDCLKLS